jgi:arylsulfatase A-like enzyme
MLTAAAAPARTPNIIVIFTDDQGYADLSCMGFERDVKTPHIDRLGSEGARFTDGYVTAPQCCPSRAGLLTGRNQNRFGLVSNGHGPLPKGQITIADRLAQVGYVTGMVGKWHLDPNHNDRAFLERHQITGAKIPATLKESYLPQARGFLETFCGHTNRYSATYDLSGNRFSEPRDVTAEGDRLDRQSDAAVRFIDLHHTKPFFLYLAYFAPHVPLASSKKYLDRFPGPMPERRRHALAMISAMDDGVGRILKKLADYRIDNDTLIFFISDNGAPLKLTMADDPMSMQEAHWNGSKNTPLAGEKGMLTEGGIRVPFLVRWKGVVPGSQVIGTPVSTLDVATTACAVAGLGRPKKLDGVDLMPMLVDGTPLADRVLHWRFWTQAAARQGAWKLLKVGSQKTFLFNVVDDLAEKHDRASEHPEIVARLEASLADWAKTLMPAGLASDAANPQEEKFYGHYFGLERK